MSANSSWWNRPAGIRGTDLGVRVEQPVTGGGDHHGVEDDVLPAAVPVVVDDLAECTPPTPLGDVAKTEKPADMAACKAQLDRVYARFFTAANDQDRRDLLVCHGNVIRYLVTRALGVDTGAWLAMSIENASITTIRIDAKGRAHVIAVGDVGHIPPAMRTSAFGDPPRDLAIPDL